MQPKTKDMVMTTPASGHRGDRKREKSIASRCSPLACSIGGKAPNNPYWGILEEGKTSLAKRERKSREYGS
ncbi:hypothetical protein Peur_063658 [Populus x canadensis]|jgi:hypothetical protein